MSEEWAFDQNQTWNLDRERRVVVPYLGRYPGDKIPRASNKYSFFMEQQGFFSKIRYPKNMQWGKAYL